MKVRFRNKLESFVRCEKQHWPDCGGPSNTFLPPHAVQCHPNLFLLGVRPKLRQQPTSKNLGSFREGCSKFQKGGLGTQSGSRLWGKWRAPGQGGPGSHTKAGGGQGGGGPRAQRTGPKRPGQGARAGQGPPSVGGRPRP